MSNYINVLRRLEREKRSGEPTPAVVAPAPAPIVPAASAPVAAPVVPAREIAPQAHEITPQVHEITPQVHEITPQVHVSSPEIVPVIPAPRTVIPLPNVPPISSSPIPTPVVPAARPEPPVAASVEPTVRHAAPAPLESTVRPAATRRSLALATETHPGIANLLDRVRAIAGERADRVVVFCGASTAEAVNALAGALATHAERCGMRAFVGVLTRTAAGTVITPASPAATSAPALAVDLDAGVSETALRQWVEHVAPGSDLVVLTGPPLATSIDAALLACASDGLVIVAESEVTERVALQTAAERARIAGCRTLGVVMHGTKDRVPGWIRRMVGDRSTAHSSRED